VSVGKNRTTDLKIRQAASESVNLSVLRVASTK
jgi:hypothetical protein